MSSPFFGLIGLRWKENKQPAEEQRAGCNLDSYCWWIVWFCFGCKLNPTTLTGLPLSSFRRTNQLTLATTANSSNSPLPCQGPLCFFTQGQQFVSALFGLHSSQAILPSPSISGHVCGGVVRRWLSRNTEALRPSRETSPYCFLWNWYCNVEMF